MSESAKRLKANKKLENRPCGWCGAVLELGDDAVICSSCETEHHAVCWDGKQGCGRRGCDNEPLKTLEESGDAAAPAAVPPGSMPCPHCKQVIPIGVQLCPICDMVTTPDGIYRGPKVMAPGATASVVWGIVGIAVCGLIIGFVAINKSREARAHIEADPRYEGEGIATAGMVLGVVDIILWAVGLVARAAGGGA